jgi:hypothetical protein
LRSTDTRSSQVIEGDTPLGANPALCSVVGAGRKSPIGCPIGRPRPRRVGLCTGFQDGFVGPITAWFMQVRTLSRGLRRCRFRALTCTVGCALSDARARLAVLERGMEH